MDSVPAIMCGLAGFWPAQGVHTDEDRAVAERMQASLRHRGPDDGGIWIGKSDEPVLVHRRLSVLDLSPAGHQPMASRSGRFLLLYNGEIYNHLELRAALPARTPWRGSSDTETLLEMVEETGLVSTLQRCVGMFALALWDRTEKTLWLARDRLGEKPMYYGVSNGIFFFGSELKSLRAHPGFAAEIDREALAEYLRRSYVPAPRSIYQGIRKLKPATLLQVRQGGRDLAETTYWDLATVAEEGRRHPFQGREEAAVEELEHLLRRSVRGQKIADVPLGAFLSGGLDSSMITALLQAESGQPVRTFTVALEDPRYDESGDAGKVARHLGTRHEELRLTPREVLPVVPELPRIYDEPFADSSQIPTLLVCRFARTQVTVSLSGDGGDELLGGYNRHAWAPLLWQRLRRIPRPLRRAMAPLLTAIPSGWWDRCPTFSIPGVSALQHRMPAVKIRKIARILSSADPRDFYERLATHGPVSPPAKPVKTESDLDFRSWMMLKDAQTYLPDDILVKVDRAAMAVSLETRMPFLDHRLVAFAWRLPMAMKVDGLQTKKILRQLLGRYVPRALFTRPKMGFGIPLGDWLRGPLREWAGDLLHEPSLHRSGYLPAAALQKTWREHQSGQADQTEELWSALMFQAWLQTA